jgi:hypothetical protein
MRLKKHWQKKGENLLNLKYINYVLKYFCKHCQLKCKQIMERPECIKYEAIADRPSKLPISNL